MLILVRRKKLERIREFVRELSAETRTERSRRVREARVVRMYLRLPGDVQKLVGAGYQQYELKDGALLISHGEVDGATTWLNVYECNTADEPRPAVSAVEVDARDLDGNIDVGSAERVLDVSRSKRRIPGNSVRRQVIPVNTRPDDDAVFIQIGRQQGKTTRQHQMAKSIYQIVLDR